LINAPEIINTKLRPTRGPAGSIDSNSTRGTSGWTWSSGTPNQIEESSLGLGITRQ